MKKKIVIIYLFLCGIFIQYSYDNYVAKQYKVTLRIDKNSTSQTEQQVIMISK